MCGHGQRHHPKDHFGGRREHSCWIARHPGSLDGTNSSAQFYQPQGMAVDGAGNLYRRIPELYDPKITRGVVST